ncbi:uncharacterized protein LOC110108602 [Dendrobium catenatum]|uniref:uncharacterized protein LOC110108602 n=1 Tax=Dendrobium catenatum TaxID=906689 RepID=UPI0009F34B89|nr:uncharacterized protein LOC110108602 [Dendrobium catenatum]
MAADEVLTLSTSDHLVNVIENSGRERDTSVELGDRAFVYGPDLLNGEKGARKEMDNYLWHLIGEHRVSLIGLPETKRELVCRKDILQNCCEGLGICFSTDYWQSRSKNKFKELTQLKEDLYKEIKVLQELECLLLGLTDAQMESLRYKVQLLNGTLARLTTWWRQRAKVKWIEEGDSNSHFFHSMASARRRAKSIGSIRQVDGTVVSEQRDIAKTIFRMLDAEVTKEEIWAVISSLGRNKAPGRDGITASFFKFYWDIVGV